MYTVIFFVFVLFLVFFGYVRPTNKLVTVSLRAYVKKSLIVSYRVAKSKSFINSVVVDQCYRRRQRQCYLLRNVNWNCN